MRNIRMIIALMLIIISLTACGTKEINDDIEVNFNVLKIPGESFRITVNLFENDEWKLYNRL